MSVDFARGSAALVFTILALTGLTPLGARAQNQPQTWTQTGMLSCKLNPSVGFIIVGHQSMECRFVPSAPGPTQFYEGALNTVGIDIGVIGRAVWPGLSSHPLPVFLRGHWQERMSVRAEILPWEPVSGLTYWSVVRTEALLCNPFQSKVRSRSM